MIVRIILLCCVLVICEAAFEGETCTLRGVGGVCTTISNCKAAIEALMRREPPQTCGFEGSTPIVCCVDKAATTTTQKPPLITTQQPPLITTQKMTSTTMYIPETPDYESSDRDGGCVPIEPSLTSQKTGQKAFDQCLNYQDKYVYPCQRSVAFTDELNRANHCFHNADGLILGGNDTKAHEFPHMAMLGYTNDEKSIQWLCGGSVISDKFILTAGHCISTRDLGEVKYVLIGAQVRSDANDPDKVYKVKRIIKHPEYNPPSKYHDITLLETEKTIRLSQYVVPACLHVGDPINDERVLATGWGLTEYKGSVAEVMQKVIITKFSAEECGIKYPIHRHMKQGLDSKTQICYGDRTESKDTCQGDSGGPIQIPSKRIHCMYVVVGVTSFGRACGFAAEPAIYTRVSHYLPWIESIVWP